MKKYKYNSYSELTIWNEGRNVRVSEYKGRIHQKISLMHAIRGEPARPLALSVMRLIDNAFEISLAQSNLGSQMGRD